MPGLSGNTQFGSPLPIPSFSLFPLQRNSCFYENSLLKKCALGAHLRRNAAASAAIFLCAECASRRRLLCHRERSFLWHKKQRPHQPLSPHISISSHLKPVSHAPDRFNILRFRRVKLDFLPDLLDMGSISCRINSKGDYLMNPDFINPLVLAYLRSEEHTSELQSRI